MWKRDLEAILNPFELSWANDSEEAIALLSREQEMDAMLTDDQFPSADAQCLLKWSRLHREDLPVIVVTSQDGKRDANFFLDLGALSVLENGQTRPKLLSLLEVQFALSKPRE